MTARHSHLHRGMQAALDPEFQARFGRMFPNAEPAKFGDTPEQVHDNLGKLAAAMVSDFDAPKDEPDDEESGVPALYTYLGQFIDHDLTFDPTGSFQKQKDPKATFDYRSAAFDLDNVYGRGPGDQPYMYQDDGKSFILGDPITLGVPGGAHDLQRNAAGRALIGDPRNDENTIVSQLQGLFLRFHNRVVAEQPNLAFEDAQAEVRRRYQYVVLHDFLPRLVSAEVLNALKTNSRFDKSKLRFFHPSDLPFMPVEFATAAYRFGHSMVRPGYRLNDAVLVPIFPLPPEQQPGFGEGLTGFRRMISDWGIDWARFIDIEVRDYGFSPPKPGDDDEAKKQRFVNSRRLQFAYRIDTSLVDPLGSLPMTVAGNKPTSLAHRNLLRGVQFGLPSGQTVARAMGLTPLKDEEILIGKGLDKPDGLRPIAEIDSVFAGTCPLWTYVLAEAMKNSKSTTTATTDGTRVNTLQLGHVGGRIVAEVFLGLMFSDAFSLLSADPEWMPDGNADYALKDIVAFALGL